MEKSMNINYVDFETYEFLAMDVLKIDDEYNLQLGFIPNKESAADVLGYRTGIFTKSLEEMGAKIKLLIEAGIFSNLSILTNGNIVDPENSAVMSKFNWSLYINC